MWHLFCIKLWKNLSLSLILIFIWLKMLSRVCVAAKMVASNVSKWASNMQYKCATMSKYASTCACPRWHVCANIFICVDMRSWELELIRHVDICLKCCGICVYMNNNFGASGKIIRNWTIKKDRMYAYLIWVRVNICCKCVCVCLSKKEKKIKWDSDRKKSKRAPQQKQQQKYHQA